MFVTTLQLQLNHFHLLHVEHNNSFEYLDKKISDTLIAIVLENIFLH